MKNMKKMLALLLAMAMMLTLAACGGTNAKNEDKDEALVQRHTSRGEETPAKETEAPTEATSKPTAAPTPEPTPEPTPAPTPEPTAEPTPDPTPEPASEGELVGTWSAQFDLTDLLLQEIESSLGEMDMNFGDYMEEPFYLPLRMEFNADESYHLYVTESDLDAMVVPFQNAMKGFFTDLLFSALKQALADSGQDVSAVNEMADLENMLGMSVDEMMTASMGSDLNSFVEQNFNVEMLKELTDELDTEGTYSFDGETIKLNTGEEMTVKFLDADTVLLDGDDGGIGLLPLTLERVK